MVCHINRWSDYLLSIPKSLYVCIRLFGIARSLRLPVVVRYNTKILGLKGAVNVLGEGRVTVGFGKISEFDLKYERTIIKFDGKIEFNTPCKIGQGSRVIVEKDGQLYIGKGFNCTARMTLSCRGEIHIGDDCLCSWNTWLCDTNFHRIVDLSTGQQSFPNGNLEIGNHVWICANSSILKGSVIPDGCVVGSGTLVKNKFMEPNSIIVGNPAHIVRKNITWIDKD